MTTKGPDFYTEIDELLSCTICLERCIQPKSLPCLHAFCMDCLQQLIHKAGTSRNINCPSCRTEVPIPPGGADSFPAAFLLKTIGETIDKFKELGLDNKPKCSTCIKNGKQTSAVILCTDCMKTLCQDCLSHHNEFIQDHNLVECTNLKAEDLNQILRRKADKCKKHNKSTELFCMSCKELICVVCGMVEHNQHEKQSLETVVQSHKDELQTFLNQLLKRDQHYDKCLSKTDTAEEDCQTNIRTKIKAVEQHEAALHKAVQALTKQTITEIETEGSHTITEILTVRQNMTQEKAKLSTTIKNIRASMNSLTMFNFNAADRDKQRYKAILHELLPQHYLPKMTFDFMFANVQQMTRESLIGSLTCRIRGESLAAGTTVPRPMKVPASKPGTLVALKVGQFTVPYEPRSVACTYRGHVVVCANDTNRASVYRSDGRELVPLELPPYTDPTDVACTAYSILVGDNNTKSVLDFKSDGSFVRDVYVGFGGNMSICVLNKVYLTSSTENKVYSVDWPHGQTKQIFVQDSANANINCPSFVAANHSSVAVSCYNNNSLHVFDRSGCHKFTYTGDGTTLGELKEPRGVVIDDDGRVLISSASNNLIHVVSSEGQPLGHIDINKDGLSRPVGLTLNSLGQLIVAAIDSQTIATYEYSFQ